MNRAKRKAYTKTINPCEKQTASVDFTDLLSVFQFNVEFFDDLSKKAKKERRTKDEWFYEGKKCGMLWAIEIVNDMKNKKGE